MLNSLYIKDFVIIDEHKVDFGQGLNIITGETGSGKSLIFKAINLILGERATPEQVRKDKTKSIIEAVFKVNQTKEIIQNLDEPEFYEIVNEIVIRKEISSSGKSRAFLNSAQISVSELKQIKPYLLDYHGQNSSTKLFDNSYQLDLIDVHGNIDLSEYSKHFQNYKSKQAELNELKESIKKAQENYDYWSFKLEEIKNVDPQESEYEDLQNELKLLENAEMIFAESERSSGLLSGEENSAENQIHQALELFKSLAKYDSSFSEFIDDLKSAAISAREAGRFAGSYKSNSDFEPWKLDQKRQRSTELKSLVKKYGSFDQIIKDKIELEEKIDQFESFDYLESKLVKELKQIESELVESGKKLSTKREAVGDELSSLLNKEFHNLGLDNARIKIKISPNSSGIHLGKEFLAQSKGFDTIQFLFKANEGGKFSELKNSASGGELSRIMLALKKIMKDKDPNDLLVFDEIDSGISGKTANLVGKYIKSISNNVQILAITHQAQLAANSDHHFQVSKTSDNGTTNSIIKKVSDEEKIEQVAKLFSGDSLSEENLLSAKQLMEN